ncbi:restriction endonuclease subunit S [Sphingopyxis sp.]|jgi:type I restriction enzyme S subunit|uniref:restriction endonuclease subunit S n=1 Tax=Sphingopyxis sp. TaxID=1908224 RepID=UPI00311E5EE4
MSDIAALVADNFDIWTGAIERKSGAGRGSGGKRVSLYGIERLRALILDLAARGKLLPQDPADEPAIKLLPGIERERQRRLTAKEIKNSKGPAKPSSEPFDLPMGWAWLPLWQTGNIFAGNSINAALRSELEANVEGRPFVATKDVGYGFDPIDYHNGLMVNFDDRRFNIARPNSVFICAEGGSAGRKMAVSDREVAFGNKLIANEPWPQIEPRYVLCTYLSDFFFDCFSREMTGIIGGISRAKFLALPFPLPPLAEQRRIVAKVDKLMVLCDALERESADALAAHQVLVKSLLATLVNSVDAADLAANWARLESHFDTLFTTEASIEALKQTFLDLAIRGLLERQLPNEETASNLIRRIGNSKRRYKGTDKKREAAFPCPSNWAWVSVQELLDPNREISYGVIKMGPEPAVGGVPTLRCSDVKPGFLDLSGVRNVAPEIEEEYIRTRLVGGEIVINIRGTLGGVSIVPDELRGHNVAREVAVIPVSSDLSNKYIVYAMLSPYFWNHILENLRGIAYKGLNLSILRDLPIPIPPLAEQQRIVAKVDELMALSDALKARLAEVAETGRHLADAIVERAAA